MRASGRRGGAILLKRRSISAKPVSASGLASLGHERNVAPAGLEARHAVSSEAIGGVSFIVTAEAFIGAREGELRFGALAFAALCLQVFEFGERVLVAAEFE